MHSTLVKGSLVCKHPCVESFSNICPVLQVRPARTRSARGPTVGWRLERTVVPLVGVNHAVCHVLRCVDRRKLITLALGAFVKLTQPHLRVRFHTKKCLIKVFFLNGYFYFFLFCKALCYKFRVILSIYNV